MYSIANKYIETKPLKNHFIGIAEVKGFKFLQLRIAQRAFLYEVNTGDTKHYEVFRKVTNRRFACISYPTSNSFGKWAWVYKSLVAANKKFYELIKEN
jgi:hypothetical protein